MMHGALNNIEDHVPQRPLTSDSLLTVRTVRLLQTLPRVLELTNLDCITYTIIP
jgi:hypothetical protein